MQPGQQQNQNQQQQGGRRGEPGHEGGASKSGHLRPEIDAEDARAERDRHIAQERQQSSGQGSGQS
jgi:hypothetical protein